MVIHCYDAMKLYEAVALTGLQLRYVLRSKIATSDGQAFCVVSSSVGLCDLFFWHHNIFFYYLNLNLSSLSPFKEMQVDKELKTRATQKVPPLFLVTIIGGFEIVLCKCFVWRVRNHFLFEAQLLLKIISCLRSWGPQFVKHPLLFFLLAL